MTPLAECQNPPKAGSAAPYTLPQGCTVEVEFEHQSRADQASYLPKVRRGGERYVVFESNRLGLAPGEHYIENPHLFVRDRQNGTTTLLKEVFASVRK